tara:strand:+ start:1757 stop:2968 length:1212 start_codon:yes stop_codon:yes gene_type:complete
MSDVKLNNKYVPLFSGNTRYYIVTGGRASGKSYGASLFLNNLTYEPNHTVLFTRYTMTSAHSSIIPEFVEKIDVMDAHEDFRVTRDEIINQTSGSNIMFKGLRTSSGNQTAALKSLAGVSTFVLDEAEELEDESLFDKIDLSVRTNKVQNRVIILMNPTTKEHWIYKRFFEAAGVSEGFNGVKGDVTYIHTTYLDNKENLPDSILHTMAMMKLNNPQKYESVIMGGWQEKAEGVIYTNWKKGNFVELATQGFGQDYGFGKDLTTLVKVSIDTSRKELYVKECFGKAEATTSKIFRENRKHSGLSIIVADNHEARLIKELKDMGLNMKEADQSAGSLLSSINLLQDYTIIVDPKSHGIIRELNLYRWKEKGSVPIDEHNHYLDALRYIFMFLLGKRNSGKYTIR